MKFCYHNASVLIKGEVERIGGFGMCRYTADDIVERLNEQLNDSRFRGYVSGKNLNRFMNRSPLSDMVCNGNDTRTCVSLINIFIEDTLDDVCSVLVQKLYDALVMINDADRLSVYEVDMVYYSSDDNSKTYENVRGSRIADTLNRRKQQGVKPVCTQLETHNE